MLEATDMETTKTNDVIEVPPTKVAASAKKAPAKKAKKTVAKKAVAPAKKTAKTAKSTQAQSGKAMVLGFDRMNKDEVKIVKAVFTPSGDRKAKTIRELQSAIGGGKDADTSPARNALRRLVRGGWLEHAAVSTAKGGKATGYRLTAKAQKRGLKGA